MAEPTTPAEQLASAADGTRRKTIADYASAVHYYAALYQNSIDQYQIVVDLAVNEGKTGAERIIGKYLGWAKGVIETQGKELALLRAIEYHLVNGSLTDENAADILNLLAEHRKSIQDKNAAAQEAQTATQQ